jgi:hypothetical protein
MDPQPKVPGPYQTLYKTVMTAATMEKPSLCKNASIKKEIIER